MKKMTILIPSWQEPEVLKVSIPYLLESYTHETQTIVILNEGDKESVDFLNQYPEVEFIKLNKNYGPLAVDWALPMVDGEYVANVNADMIFPYGWQDELLEIIANHYPCTSSCHLVETFHSNNPIVSVDNLGDWLSKDAAELFLLNYSNGKYILPNLISYTHPILTLAADFRKVTGYSNFDLNWFPGYGLDDWYPYKLKQLDPKYNFITASKSCVFHGSSFTSRKLSQAIRDKNNSNYFQQLTGRSIQQFRQEINIFSQI